MNTDEIIRIYNNISPQRLYAYYLSARTSIVNYNNRNMGLIPWDVSDISVLSYEYQYKC